MTANDRLLAADASATDVADAVRTGELHARAVVDAALDRIERSNGRLNAFVHVDAAAARRAAEAVDRAVRDGRDPGPLAGVPFAVKDNEALAGSPTRFGSLVHEQAVAETTDSVHVARLRDAGAVPIGKLAMAEFGLDGVTHTLLHGTTRNPWDLDTSPGGSSGGSAAAVSAGQIPLATASDALGSLRGPAGFTGLVGLKPSHGRIPRAHGFRDTASLGALTRTVRDTARYLDVVAGPDNRDRMSLPAPGVRYESLLDALDVRGLRVAWSADLGFAPLDPAVAAVCERAFEALAGAAELRVHRRDFACTNVYTEWNALAAIELQGDFERAGILPDAIDRISPGPRAFIESARALSERERADYRALLRQLEAEIAALFDSVDVLVTPTACCTAYPAAGPLPDVIAGRDASRTHGEPYTAIASLCWNPCVSVPAGLTPSGHPVGLLMTGPRHRDDVVLRLARLLETSLPWPPLAPGWL